MSDLFDTMFKLETSLLLPEVRNSFDSLDRLIADDFIEFGSSGLTYDKNNILQRLPSSTEGYIYTISDFDIKILSADIVLTTFKTTCPTETPEKFISLRSSLWRKAETSWQIFFHQGTTTN